MTMIPIESLHQPTLHTHRDGLDQGRIQHYVKHPDEIRGILVYEDPANGLRITVNGHHRVESARRLGWTDIDADIRPGVPQDALIYQDLERRP
jgi:hypothetical protein